jgi:hypothetical protein
MESGTFAMGRVGFNGPTGGGYSSIHLDDIVVLATVPEPSNTALLSGVVLLLGLLLRRRFR